MAQSKTCSHCAALPSQEQSRAMHLLLKKKREKQEKKKKTKVSIRKISK